MSALAHPGEFHQTKSMPYGDWLPACLRYEQAHIKSTWLRTQGYYVRLVWVKKKEPGMRTNLIGS